MQRMKGTIGNGITTAETARNTDVWTVEQAVIFGGDMVVSK